MTAPGASCTRLGAAVRVRAGPSGRESSAFLSCRYDLSHNQGVFDDLANFSGDMRFDGGCGV